MVYEVLSFCFRFVSYHLNLLDSRPLHLAAAQKHMTDVLVILLKHGADVNAYNDDRLTPVFFATSNDNQFGAKILLQHGTLFYVCIRCFRFYESQSVLKKVCICIKV